MKEYKIETLVHIYEPSELSKDDLELVEAAKRATEGSYAPYSKFRVGAAARLQDGTIVVGANQENAAYPSGLCAERTALFAAGAQPISPCGACRQVISGVEERYGTPVRILLYGTEGTLVSDGISPLLPLRFIDEDMR